MEIATQKYKLEKEFKEELKLFLFAIRTDLIMANQERLAGVIAYRQTDAMIEANRNFCPPGSGMKAFSHGDYILISLIIDSVENGTKLKNVSIEPVLKPEVLAPKYSKEQFISGLLLVCDDYIKSKDVKKIIKEELERIK